MLRFCAGDSGAFAVLLQRYQRPIHAFVARYLGPSQASLAEDLTQETFLRLVKNAKSYDPGSRFSTWLYTLARNLCIDAHRRHQHRRAQSLDAPGGPDGDGAPLVERTSDQAPGVDRRVMGRELQARMQRAIQALPEDQREVFLLREFSDLQFKDIAVVIGISENTVKSRMRYALEKLRAELRDFEDLAHSPES